MRIVEDDLTGAEIQALLERHAEGMAANSPLGACHYLDLAGLQAPEVTVWTIWDEDSLAGCGALREIDPKHGEIKSMRTADDHLGKGVGRKMLNHVIAIAQERGYERLSLETGSNESFAAALYLYESSGFDRCGAFDTYEDTDFSVFMTKELTP